jgi:hypothetical protein
LAPAVLPAKDVVRVLSENERTSGSGTDTTASYHRVLEYEMNLGSKVQSVEDRERAESREHALAIIWIAKTSY